MLLGPPGPAPSSPGHLGIPWGWSPGPTRAAACSQAAHRPQHARSGKEGTRQMARGQAGGTTPCGQSTQTSLCCLLRTVPGDTWGGRVWPQRQASRISAKLSVFQEAFLDRPPPPSGTALLAASAPVLPSPHPLHTHGCNRFAHLSPHQTLVP